MSTREAIEIDYCPQCRGVWLDRGELDKIIARTSDAAPSPGYRDRGEHREKHHDSDYRRRKPKSMLKELFDF